MFLSVLQQDGRDGPRGGVAPHRPLLGYYEAPDARAGFVRSLFNRTAGSYDGINRVLSLGSGAWYRRRVLLDAGLKPGMKVLDVAVGTGLLAREAARITGRDEDVIGLDLSEGMLAVAARSLRIPLVQARAEALPIADESIDLLTMGYALRHVADLVGTFAEYGRVLRPGGRVLLLELGRPESRASYAVARAWLGGVVPALSAVAGREARMLMRYYWDTIDACVPAEEIVRCLATAGLEGARCDTQMGLFRSYTARRPAA